MSEAVWATDEDATEAKKLLRKMNKARNFPTETCPYSRHTALMAECLVKDRRYEMLLEEPIHCAESLAVTVWLLWEARAALAAKDAEIERLRAALKGLVPILEAVRYTAGLGKNQMARVEKAKALIATETPQRADLTAQEPRSGVPGSQPPASPSGDPE